MKTGIFTSSPHWRRSFCARRGIVELDLAQLQVALVVAALLRRLQSVHHDFVERPAERRHADLLDGHAVAELIDASMPSSVQPIA